MLPIWKSRTARGECAQGEHPGARAAILGSFLAVGLLFIWKARGDWMHEWRFVAPLVPVFSSLMGAGVSAARKAALVVPSTAPSRRILHLLAAAGMTGCILAWRSELGRLDQVRRTGDVPAVSNMQFGAAMQKDAAELGMRRPLVAVTDLGGFRARLFGGA